jgi:hypothetical protein
MSLSQERFEEILFDDSPWMDMAAAVFTAVVMTTVFLVSGNTLAFAIGAGSMVGLVFIITRLFVRLVWGK